MTFADYKKVLVQKDMAIIDAIKQMTETSMQILLVAGESDRLEGVVTDGDIRRAFAEDFDFHRPISSIMNASPISMGHPIDKHKALHIMKELGIQHIPIVDEDKRITGLILWKDFLKNGDLSVKNRANTVVIMAGGKGTRLDLFTKILPKPLIPVAEKPIIDHIMDNFARYGFNRFLISLNYKGDMIKMYFSDNPHNYAIDFVEEDDFLGTAGALSLIKNKINDAFIVSNCDVIIDANLDLLFNFHEENNNHATILGTLRNIKIPYGVLKSQQSDLEHIIEKPEYSFMINSGIYVLSPEILDLVPNNQAVDMPDLLLKAKDKGMKVQVFPMTCSWFDVGQWSEYKRAIDHMNSLGVAA